MIFNLQFATIKRVLLIFAGILIFAAAHFPIAQAATIGVVVDNPTPEIGQPIRVDIPLDTQGDDANAIQAQIIFPASQFTLKSVSDGASPVSFWIEAPTEIASDTVAFSGIMPGGFRGAASSVVSLWLTPTASGDGVISLGDVQLLRNDGQATSIQVATTTATIEVSPTMASSTPTTPVSFITPEPFTPVISRDPNIFAGQYFLSFSTTDKGSGIDRYEVMEAPGSWQVATSPYLLHDQSLESNIYIRAIDHAGNFIVVEVPAEHPPGTESGHIQGEILVIVLCLLLIILIAAARTLLSARRKRKRV